MNCLPLVAVATLALSVPLWFRLSLYQTVSAETTEQKRPEQRNSTTTTLQPRTRTSRLFPPASISPIPSTLFHCFPLYCSLRDRDNLKNRTREQVVFYTACPHDSSQTSTRITSISNILSISDMIRSSSFIDRFTQWKLCIVNRSTEANDLKKQIDVRVLIKRIRLNECEEMRMVLVYQVKWDQTNTWK